MLNDVRWLLQGERRVGAYRCENVAAQSHAMDILSLKLLVVDDIPICRMLMSGMLRVLFPNAAVDEAGDGAQAQVMLRNQHYDMVLSDWMMPDMDGLQLAAWMHSGEIPPRPFVLFSANDGVDEILPLFSSHGIDGYLIKPLDQATMKELISASIWNLALAA